MTTNKIKANIRKWYDEISTRYDNWGARKGESNIGTFNEEFKSFKKLVKISKNDKVLDIATGTGNYLIEMVKHGANGHGIDISKKMLEVLERKMRKLNLISKIELNVASAEKIPYPDSYFDWVTCIGMFEYYPASYVKTVLKEIKRVIKPNGKVIVDFPDIENPKTHVFKENERNVGHKIYLYDLDYLKKVVESIGFRIDKIKRAGIEVQFLLSV